MLAGEYLYERKPQNNSSTIGQQCVLVEFDQLVSTTYLIECCLDSIIVVKVGIVVVHAMVDTGPKHVGITAAEWYIIYSAPGKHSIIQFSAL